MLSAIQEFSSLQTARMQQDIVRDVLFGPLCTLQVLRGSRDLL